MSKHQFILDLYIYIYIYCHPQTNCFIVSQLFSVARLAGCFKLGSKPPQLYIRFSILLFRHQVTYVSLGVITHYVLAFVCSHFALPDTRVHNVWWMCYTWNPESQTLPCKIYSCVCNIYGVMAITSLLIIPNNIYFDCIMFPRKFGKKIVFGVEKISFIKKSYLFMGDTLWMFFDPIINETD